MKYYKIIVKIKGRLRLLGGVRAFESADSIQVYYIVWSILRKFYEQKEILDVKVQWLPPGSKELDDFSDKKANV